VTFVESTRVEELLPSSDGRGVAGVVIAPQAPKQESQRRTLRADFVVDATGRGSRLPKWLIGMGFHPPVEEVVDANMGYATCVFSAPADVFDGRRLLQVAPVPGENPRAAGLWQVEGGQWLLTLIGLAGEHPPTDPEGFLRFARQLNSPLVAEFIEKATPVGSIRPYRRTANRWRHYERLSDFPERLAVVGDAVCALNPMFGQGITLGMLEIEALDRALGRAKPAAVWPRYRRQISAIVRLPWLLATMEDFRWEEAVGRRAPLLVRTLHRYVDAVTAISLTRPIVVRAFLRVTHLIASPLALVDPRISLPALRLALVRLVAPPASNPLPPLSPEVPHDGH